MTSEQLLPFLACKPTAAQTPKKTQKNAAPDTLPQKCFFISVANLPAQEERAEHNPTVLDGQPKGHAWLIGSPTGRASCQLHQIEPWGHLRDLFCSLPDWPKADVLSLAQVYWKETSARPEVVAKLESNPYRRIADTYAAGPESSSQNWEVARINDVVC